MNPPFFAGYPVGARTKHFMVTYAAENDADAPARAQAIGECCERDLDTLEDWFDRDFDRSEYSIWVHVAPGVHLGGASNTGFDSQQSSRIRGTGGTAWVRGYRFSPRRPCIRPDTTPPVQAHELAPG